MPKLPSMSYRLQDQPSYRLAISMSYRDLVSYRDTSFRAMLFSRCEKSSGAPLRGEEVVPLAGDHQEWLATEAEVGGGEHEAKGGDGVAGDEELECWLVVGEPDEDAQKHDDHEAERAVQDKHGWHLGERWGGPCGPPQVDYATSVAGATSAAGLTDFSRLTSLACFANSLDSLALSSAISASLATKAALVASAFLAAATNGVPNSKSSPTAYSRSAMDLGMNTGR
jgi:hypothetical protein